MQNGTNGHDDSNVEQQDSKVTPFPSRRQREEKRRVLRIANDMPNEPILNLPPTVQYLCAALVAVFVVCQVVPDDVANQIVLFGGFIPARYTGGLPFDAAAYLSPVLHMFLHGGWLHIGLNIAMLMAFGAGIEKAIGGKKLLLLCLLSGLVGALTHGAFFPHLETPMIGASGAVSGLFGAIMMLMQENGAMGQGYRRLIPFVIVWILISVVFGYVGVPGNDNPIAWTTHVGGFLCGLLLYRPIQRL
jgi:membrane associated rhomboid family serine protease